MDKARDLINAHLYPVLATFVVIYGAIQIAPMANQARHFNQCVETIEEVTGKPLNGIGAVAVCNGAPVELSLLVTEQDAQAEAQMD
ncbi:MAG: hypothetical protein CMN91_00155 [Synechococcus sp. ARS1019]|nr:hypothetical protein [Synechococcus sp. ARS1019]|tara:strand:- start:186 stop:443 length:258 start_codon:yes stop_codon:yes gene_type:complete